MALDEYEFLGHDRYFKYRYKQEVPINVTTIEETWDMPNIAARYHIMKDYMKRAFNIKMNFGEHKLSYFDIFKVYSDPYSLNKSHVTMIPVTRSYFDGRLDYFSPFPPFETTRTIIVSAAPKRVTSTSLSFLNIDVPVLILMGSTLVLLSILLVLHNIVTNKYKALPTKKVAKKLAQETLENVWENASLLCSEPIPAVLPHITCRLLAASWIVGVTFILFFLGCYLRTEFTTESYNSIETLSDLIKSGIPPIMIKESGTFEYLKVLAAEDPAVKKWLDGLDQNNIFSSPMDYLMLDGYIPILSGEKVLITEDTFMIWITGQYLKDNSESKELFVNQGGFYFSQHQIRFDYLHCILNTSWATTSPQILENTQLSLEPFFETQFLNYLNFHEQHLTEQVKWKRPLKSTADLDLNSVIVPFYLLFMLWLGTVAAVLTEIFFKQFA